MSGSKAQGATPGARPAEFVKETRLDGLPLDDDGFEAQALQAMQNLLETLRAAA
jgi:hypothetical protein